MSVFLEGGDPSARRATTRREVFLGESKLDFLVGGAFLEVKAPLQQLQVDVPSWARTKKRTPFSSTGRMQRHVGERAASLADHQRAVLPTCFVYGNLGFGVVERSASYEQVSATMAAAQERGVEAWQANFRITPERITLQRVAPLSL